MLKIIVICSVQTNCVSLPPSMNLNGIKNIIFDFGGVICDLHADRCLDSFAQLGCKLSLFPTQYSQFDGIFKLIDRGEINNEQFCEALRRESGKPGISDEEIRQAWLSVLGEIPEERFEALDILRQKYNLYILSNTNEMHWQYISQKSMQYRGQDTTKWFKGMFLSHKLHLEKPEPEIYKAVLDIAKIKAEESLFIDDNIPNLEAAAAMGFNTLHSTGGDWVSKIM